MSSTISYDRKTFKLYAFGKIPVTLNFNMAYGQFYSLLDINVGNLKHTSLKVSLWLRPTESGDFGDFIASTDWGGFLTPFDGGGGGYNVACYYQVKPGTVSLGMMNTTTNDLVPATPYSTGILSYYVAYF